ncbi:MAG TPA: glycosyltransferase [Sphingomonas sp.]|jgi:glycosyltransferase involved in cell wall biosynthesis|uniref:glycosyltransferase n=1 Tax=Sphingomonas sp. TaxID=28214 RepID=UPI002EDA1C1D
MIRVLLVDPSLYTAPYDAALSAGLAANGVAPRWAVRDLRPGEEGDIPEAEVAMHFYRLTDGRRRRSGKAWKLVKGVEHAIDLRRMERLIAREAYDVVHFQWAALPRLDVAAIRRIARGRPVVFTVHDTTPLNGADVSQAQVQGYDMLFTAAQRLIVHTQGARDALIARGVDAARIAVVAHGPIALRLAPRPDPDKPADRWRVVLFGRLQAYKGVDVLVEALGLLPAETRARLNVVVAGDPLMNMAPILARAEALGLHAPTLTFRLGRLDDRAMSDLLGSADAFVFPYRAIEASGVLFLVAGFRKWMIASRLGAFVDAIGSAEGSGALVEPGDAAALAAALADGIGRAPCATGMDWAPEWSTIGRQTADLYQQLVASHCRQGIAHDVR